MEHAARVGSKYEQLGLSGQRIASVGYSHWLEEADGDTTDATRQCIRQVISGGWRIAFFTQIRNYFGFQDHETFWEPVMFFNYLPNCVGNVSRRFHHGTPEQRRLAQYRFLRLIGKESPQKVLVFTSRRWAFPTANGARPDQELGPDFPKFSYRTYGVDGHRIVVFFLRHPQGANGKLMRRAVEHVLGKPNLRGNR